MKFPLRIILRILFLIVVLVLLGGGGLLAVFTSWRSDRLAALDAVSEIAQTGNGPMEFRVHGEGPAVIVFHDAPGGYDQAMLYGANLADAGFQIVAPSRPGYLRTPLTTGLLPIHQAEAAASLLDMLGLPRVAVVGVGNGGPAAVAFALAHPERVRALVLISAIYKGHPPNEVPRRGYAAEWIRRSLTGDIGSWLVYEAVRKNPRRVLGWLLEGTSEATTAQQTAMIDTIVAQPKQLEWFQGLIDSFTPISPREQGTRNDQVLINSMQEVHYADLKVPTLIVHGQLDRNSPLAEAKDAAAKIPGATLLEVKDTGALVELGPHGEEVQKAIVDFLKANSGTPAQP